MPHDKKQSHVWDYSRKNIGADHNILRAESVLYGLYYVYLREHPELAPLLANLLLRLDECRAMLRNFHTLCWERTPKNFDDVGTMADLLTEAYRDVMGRDAECQGYLSDLEAGAQKLYALQLRLDGRLPKPSDLLDH